MAVRFYLLPLQPASGIGAIADGNYARPKYVLEAGVSRCDCAPYGLETTYLVAADVTGAQHTALAANGDVTALPLDIDQQIGGNLAAVQSALEALRIPAGWVTSGMTYHTVLAVVRRLFAFLQRFGGISRKSIFDAGITLDSTISQLTQNQRNVLQAAADAFAIDTSTITGATTIRQALKIVSDQMPPVTMFGVSL